MPVLGAPRKTPNPEFKDVIFNMYCPNFKNYLSKEDNRLKYEYFKEIANKRISKSLFGTDWEMAMSYCIAFYLTELVKQEHKGSQSLSRLADESAPKGRIDSYSVGSLSKNMSFDSIMTNNEDALFWNQNEYGVKLYALAKTHGTLTMMVAI